MTWTPDTESETLVTVKVSRLAIIAISFAFLGLILLVFGFMSEYVPRAQSPIDSFRGLFFLSSLIMFVFAIVFGISSWIQIEISGGLKTGSKFSIGAIVIAILGSILPIVFLFFVRTRSVAFRMVCGTNLSGIGKAMLIYANDYGDEYPRAGGKNSTWGTSVKWDATNRMQAYGTDASGNGGSATISSSLYLLVKYAEVTPRSFICTSGTGGDKGVSEFKPPRNVDLVQLWDFGSEPWKHNSYSYHMPYGQYYLTTSDDPGMAIAADRNPFMPSVGWDVKDFAKFDPNGDKSVTKNGNTPCHQDEGQNVLYLDSHVDFENVSFCGVNQDNIYTYQNGNDIRKGKVPKIGSQPAGKTDSLLVNDPPSQSP